MSSGDFTVVYVGSTENSKNDLMDDGEYEEKGTFPEKKHIFCT